MRDNQPGVTPSDAALNLASAIIRKVRRWIRDGANLSFKEPMLAEIIELYLRSERRNERERCVRIVVELIGDDPELPGSDAIREMWEGE